MFRAFPPLVEKLDHRRHERSLRRRQSQIHFELFQSGTAQNHGIARLAVENRMMVKPAKGSFSDAHIGGGGGLLLVMLLQESMQFGHGVEMFLLPISISVDFIPSDAVESTDFDALFLVLFEFVFPRENSATERTVGVEFDAVIAKARNQFRFHLARDGTVHALCVCWVGAARGGGGSRSQEEG